MGTITNTTGFVDYTVDLATLATKLDDVKLAISQLPDYSVDLGRIATALEAMVALMASANNIQNTISTKITALESSVAEVKTSLTDATKGVYTQKVDLPYQSVYQRALLKSSLGTADIIALNRAVQEERQLSIFTDA